MTVQIHPRSARRQAPAAPSRATRFAGDKQSRAEAAIDVQLVTEQWAREDVGLYEMTLAARRRDALEDSRRLIESALVESRIDELRALATTPEQDAAVERIAAAWTRFLAHVELDELLEDRELRAKVQAEETHCEAAGRRVAFVKAQTPILTGEGGER